MKFSIVIGLFLIGCLCAEPRTWKSTSGSTIEAQFIGAFGEDYWFETAEDGNFIKMPAKYIAESDLKLVESGKEEGALPAKICDSDPASIRLMELIYTSLAEELGPDCKSLDKALEQLIAPFQPTEEDEEPIKVSFKKRKYKATAILEKPKPGTAFEVLTQLLEPHELSFQIREGELQIGKRSTH